jgi:hypothetical protein
MPVLTTDFFKRWHKWGLPAFAVAIGPWQDKLTKISLISNWFQPGVNVAASVVGPLFCLVTFASLHSASRARQQRLCVFFLIGFVASLTLCFALHFTMGVTIFPSPTMQMYVWVLWVTGYLGIFALLGMTAVSATLATPRLKPAKSPARKRKSQKKPSRESLEN